MTCWLLVIEELSAKAAQVTVPAYTEAEVKVAVNDMEDRRAEEVRELMTGALLFNVGAATQKARHK